MYLSFPFLSFYIHPTLPPLGSSQAASAGSALCFFLFLLLFFDGWGLTGSYGSFRSSQLRCPSHVPEELGWCKPIKQIFPHNRCNAHTCTHTPITLTHSRHLVLTAHCLLPLDLPGSAFVTRLRLSSCPWLGHRKGRQNRKLQITAGLSATLRPFYIVGVFSPSFRQPAWSVEWAGLAGVCANNLSGNVEEPELTNIVAPRSFGVSRLLWK